VIGVHGLARRYRKSVTLAVDGISFEVGAGELFAVQRSR